MEYMTNEHSASADSKAAPKEGEGKNEPGPGRARPVVIHRAIIGSFERFLGILTEHYAGKWPFWLSPRQILIVPVMPAANDYVEELQKILRGDKLNVDIDISGNTMAKKIAVGNSMQYNFILVVGASEKSERSVNIRIRDDPVSQKKGVALSLEDARAKFKSLRKERRLENTL
jgi:threonyl-tRNA synthetase